MINKFKILFHTKSRDFLLMTKILIFVLVDGSTANIYIFFQCHTFDRYLLLLKCFEIIYLTFDNV